MNKKLININNLTGYDKLDFIAKIKDSKGDYLIQLKADRFSEIHVKNQLVFAH